jgi:hypothetical protein
MAKLKNDEIGVKAIDRWLKESSDFAFELWVQTLVASLGFECRHGGTYTDPVTKKPRQFDLRATGATGLPS